MDGSLFQTVKAALSGRMEEVVTDLLPGGRVMGREYVCASLAGGQGDSCKTNLSSGVGCDFATGERWSDVIDLAVRVWNVSPFQAAKRLTERFGIPVSMPGAHRTDRPAAVMPISDDAPPHPRRHPQYGEAIASWCYRDAKGKPLFHTLRFHDARKGKAVLPLCLERNAQGRFT